MGDKQNDAVIANTKNNKENMKIHVHIPCTCRFMIHICTHTYTKKIQGKKAFYDKVISL